MEEVTLARELVRLRPHSAPDDGPLVSIVITNRDGEEHLRRLLDGLKSRTNYRSLELVLVDNGSTDGSLRVLDDWPGPKRVLANQENQSFSAANNQGIRAANGDLVLLANNDIDPIHPDWLGYMVQSLTDDVTAVGALLVYPTRPPQSSPPAHPDLTVQHRGTYFVPAAKGVRATNADTGTDPLAIRDPRPRDVPGVTAACLLARRSDLLENLLDQAYWYGSEDWDLCLRLGNLGRVVVDERAALFHHEYGTQDKYLDDAWLKRRTKNHRWFNELWGPSILRRLRLEVTGRREEWFFRGDRVPTAFLTATRGDHAQRVAENLATQLREDGWEIPERRPGQVDLAIALSPPDDVRWFGRQDLSVAVVLDEEAEWATNGRLAAATAVLADDDLTRKRLEVTWGAGVPGVLTEPAGSGTLLLDEILTAVRPRDDAMRIGVATCAPDWKRAQLWGDTHLARGLMRGFTRLGHETKELIASDWHRSAAASCDVVIHLRGLTRRRVARGQWNVLWILSHPDLLKPGECDEYDLVATASQQHAERLSAELGRTVHFVPQGTDADTFRIGPESPDFHASVLYVGNTRRPHRRAPRWLLQSGRPFDLYGQGWEDAPEATRLQGDYIPNRQLPTAYRSASVVVADHHGSMRREGFLANRLFDVLASGGVVLSDDVAGLHEFFGDLIPSYSNERELDDRLDELLGDPARRRQLAAEGRRFVMSGHTLDHRARRFLELLDEL